MKIVATNPLATNRQEKAVSPLPTIASGVYFKKGQGFSAMSYREAAFEGRMDPLVMVDHYHMTTPTFGAHPHAGLSAVSLIFEDSVGHFRNLDSMGNDIDLAPGDLYWLSAGKGAVHDEYPHPGSSTHGLQVFVNTPSAMKHAAPESLHIKAEDMPIIQSDGCRVRVVLGETHQVRSTKLSPTVSMTILDGFLQSKKHFTHLAAPSHNTWIIALQGELEVRFSDKTVVLQKDEALALEAFGESKEVAIQVLNSSTDNAHFVMFSGHAINESFVQDGPFVMNTQQEIDQVRADYAAGKLGAIPATNPSQPTNTTKG